MLKELNIKNFIMISTISPLEIIWVNIGSLKIFKRRNFNMQDKVIVCKDCGQEFTFTVGEQEFYKEKGFDNEPVRCPACRRARKQQNNRR